MLFSLTSKQAPDRRVNLRPPRSRTIGLALGAGSARGWAHIGVIRELADHGIMPDVVAGTSIGAVIGGAYAAGKLDALEIFARGLNRRRVFTLMDLSLGGSGLMAGGRLKRRLNRDLSGLEIERLAIPFAAVAAEMTTGNEIWMTKGNLVEAVRASYALPGIFEPVLVDGRWLFDGALVNPVPVSVCRSLGADIVIGVNLIADIGARMPPGARAASRPTRSAAAHAFVTDDLADQDFADQDVADQHLAAESAPSARLPLRKRGRLFSSRRMFLRRENGAPGIASVMMDAFSISQDRISRSRLAIDPADIMISARSTTCGLFDFHKAAELIEYGRTATRGALPAIEAILAETRSVPN